MSKQRKAARVEREAAATARADTQRVQRERDAATRAKRDRRSLWWRRVRLWQSGQGRRDTRERIGVLAAVSLLVLVAVFVATRSLAATVGTALILLIGSPVLMMVLFDRRKR